MNQHNVQCKSGFNGGGEYRCLPSGEFEGEPCVRIQCAQKVPHKNNSEELILLSGESIELECADGYGDAGTWSCSFEGELSGNPCRRKCIQEVPNLQGEQYVISYFGDEAFELDCEEGYYSEAIYQCNEDGEFNFSPKCSPVRCDAFPVINNSNIDAPVIGKLHGEEIEIRCDEGTYGNQRISCSSSGSWEIPTCNSCPEGHQPNQNQTACVVSVCEEQVIENSLSGIGFGVGTAEVTSVICDSGYEGGDNYRCTASGWIGDPCLPRACSDLDIPNSNYKVNKLQGGVYGDNTSDVVCDSGFTENGETLTWSCDLDEGGEGNVAWQGPSCERKTCDDLVSGDIPHALILALFLG